jgi:hypothetical protein
VLALLNAEHGEFVFVPAHHQIQTETAVADMIRGRAGFGRDDRIEERCVHRGEHRHALRRREQPRRPGEGLEPRSLVIGIAAITLPARQRQHEIEPSVIRHSREAQIVGPASGPTFGDQRRRAPRR